MSDQVLTTNGFILLIVFLIILYNPFIFLFGKLGLKPAIVLNLFSKKSWSNFFSFAKRFFLSLNSRQKSVVSFLSGLFLLNLVFLVMSDRKETRSTYFWPFDTGSRLKYDYDFLEFFSFAVIPWVIFLINRALLNNDKIRKQD